MPRGVVAIGFVLFVVLIGLALPALLNAAGSKKIYYTEIPENETQRVAGEVNVSVTEANITGGYSKVRVIDLETLENEQKTIQDGDNATFSFASGNVTVTNNQTSSKGTRLNVGVPTSYGWSAGARVMGDHMPLVLLGMVLGIVLVFAAVAIGGGGL